MKVSVIVPVYNAQKTLNICLKSLMNQTLEDIEIICVDDCSSDESWMILQEWERRYPEKMIITRLPVNSGAGGARNCALQYASGEYIGFCDSDDIVHSDMYQALYYEAKSGDYDFVDCGYLDEKEDKGYLKTGEDCIGELNPEKRNKLIVAGGYLVSHIYKRELFDGIEFRKNIILEDMEVLMELILKANKISFVKEIYYKYCYYDDSSSRKQNVYKYHEAIIGAVDAIKEKVMSHEKYESVRLAVEYAVTYLLVLGAINVSQKGLLSQGDRKIMSKAITDRYRNLIKTPMADNLYSQAKIIKEDQLILKNLMGNTR